MVEEDFRKVMLCQQGWSNGACSFKGRRPKVAATPDRSIAFTNARTAVEVDVRIDMIQDLQSRSRSSAIRLHLLGRESRRDGIWGSRERLALGNRDGSSSYSS
jgi:hypothetical protein